MEVRNNEGCKVFAALKGVTDGSCRGLYDGVVGCFNCVLEFRDVSSRSRWQKKVECIKQYLCANHDRINPEGWNKGWECGNHSGAAQRTIRLQQMGEI